MATYYSSFELIDSWDQNTLRQSTALILGAGALGNEVIKNLALLVVGRLIIVDFDHIEDGNLSRSVLFRASDTGLRKAAVAAQSARNLNPEVDVIAIDGDVRYQIGAGFFRHADIVLSCLDNRETRLYVNRACWRVARPWIDGGMNAFLGECRLFRPGEGGCYECSFSSHDYEIINRRYSCTALLQEMAEQERIPTLPTTSSIIGGLMVQEALKMLHGMENNFGSGVVVNGKFNEFYTVQYTWNPECFSHTEAFEIVECPELTCEHSLADVFAFINERFGKNAALYFDFDLLTEFECPKEGTITGIYRPLRSIHESEALCSSCGALRWAHRTHHLYGTESFLDKSLREIGVPSLDLIGVSFENRFFYIELTGDIQRLKLAK